MRLFFALLGFLMLTLPAVPAMATEGGDDFGQSYFTADAPAALEEKDDMDFWADQLGTIAPAAGGEDLFPDQIIETEALSDPERLSIPDGVPLLSPGYISVED